MARRFWMLDTATDKPGTIQPIQMLAPMSLPSGGDRCFDVDDGFLTGAFFGHAHEGMGGTLERDDLTAALGGRR